MADDTTSGEASIFVDGEAIVSASFDEARGVTTWTSAELGAQEAARAAMSTIAERGGAELLDAFVPGPQAFPCSDWGKKVLKAGKYIWGSVVVAGQAVCCSSSGGLGCAACLVGGWNLIEAGSESLEGYCE